MVCSKIVSRKQLWDLSESIRPPLLMTEGSCQELKEERTQALIHCKEGVKTFWICPYIHQAEGLFMVLKGCFPRTVCPESLSWRQKKLLWVLAEQDIGHVCHWGFMKSIWAYYRWPVPWTNEMNINKKKSKSIHRVHKIEDYVLMSLTSTIVETETTT